MTPDDELLFEDAGRSAPRGKSARPTKAAARKGDESPSRSAASLEDPYVVILASAGTGKTFQLTNRYLTLLRSGSPERILASTFTRKAAGEILDRILVRLASAITDAAELSRLQKFVGQPDVTRDECLSLLQQLTRQLHRVQISTLDALFSKLASSHTFELGFPPGWRLIEEVESARLIDQAIESVLRMAGRQDARRLMHLLSKGENSRRVHDLVRETVQTFSVPFLLTTEADWNRIPDLPLLNELELSGAIAAFESTCCTDKRVMNAISKNQEQVRSGDWEGFIASGIPLRLVKGDDTYYNKPLPPDVVAAYLPLVEHAKALFYKIWASQTRGTWETLDRVYRELTRLKDEEQLLDFGDVSRRLASRITDRSVREVTFRLDTDLDHLLLDEFQDTSLNQWQILRPFAEVTTSEPGKSFFCVGDRKQAIYGWRGGEAAIFDTIQQEFPQLEKRPLDTSRRSSPPVIEAVNRTFTSLRGTGAFDSLSQGISDWCEAFPLHDTALQEMPGYVQLEVADTPPVDPSQPNAKPSKAERSDLVLERTADRVAEYARLAPSATIAILFRGNASIRLLANKLRQRGLEFSEEGGTLITDSAAVQLLLSLLKIADHPGDRVARFHVATSPLADIHQIGRWDDDSAAMTLSQHLRSRLLSDGYQSALQRWILQLGDAITEHDRSRLRQLLELAEGYLATTRPRDFIQLVQTRKVENTTPARIQLMTVHKSKGLQFDIVFLPDLDTSLTQAPKYLTAKPSQAAAPDRVLVYRAKDLREILPPELQEAYEQTQITELTGNMCVLYVAMTRSIHALHMILPAKESNATPKSLAGVLIAGLGGSQPATPQTTLYECGDPRWFEQCLMLLRPVPTRSVDRQLAMPTFAPLTGGRRRGMERVTPSKIADKATHVKLAAVLEKRPLSGAGRGTLFHAWLEQLSWLEDWKLSDQDLLEIAHTFPTGDLDIDACVKQFRSLLKRPQIVNVLSKKNYLKANDLPCLPSVSADGSVDSIEPELSRELGFSVIDAGQLVSGTIDRLVLLRRGGQVIAADILDFKTDALRKDDDGVLHDLINAYRDQMRAYARAVSLIYRLSPERISTRLVLLSAGKVVDVEGGST